MKKLFGLALLCAIFCFSPRVYASEKLTVLAATFSQEAHEFVITLDPEELRKEGVNGVDLNPEGVYETYNGIYTFSLSASNAETAFTPNEKGEVHISYSSFRAIVHFSNGSLESDAELIANSRGGKEVPLSVPFAVIAKVAEAERLEREAREPVFNPTYSCYVMGTLLRDPKLGPMKQFESSPSARVALNIVKNKNTVFTVKESAEPLAEKERFSWEEAKAEIDSEVVEEREVDAKLASAKGFAFAVGAGPSYVVLKVMIQGRILNYMGPYDGGKSMHLDFRSTDPSKKDSTDSLLFLCTKQE